jgi:hypothetical protein
MTAIPTGMQRAMLVASAFALAVPAAGPAGAERTADPAAAAPSGNVTVDVLTVNGSGCPAGTARVTPAPDNTGFRVAYSRYAAEVGPGADPTELRKNCQLSLLVRVPQGFTYAIARADYSGVAHLAGGATGRRTTTSPTTGSAGRWTAAGTRPTSPPPPNSSTRPAARSASSTSTPNCGWTRARPTPAGRPVRSR